MPPKDADGIANSEDPDQTAPRQAYLSIHIFSEKLRENFVISSLSISRRKRGEKGEVIETPANQITRKLTIERIEELKQMIQEEQQKFK